MNLITICVMCLLVTDLETRILIDDYDLIKDRILDEERLQALGGKLSLTHEEEEANQLLMLSKHKEVDEAFQNPEYLNFSTHFFKYREIIKTSKVYQMIRKMPKGAALHIHSSYMLDADSMIELTYEDHCYACYHDNLKLHFSDRVPALDCPVNWTLLSELRAKSDNVTRLDNKLKKHFTLVTDDESAMYSNINDIWTKFETLHGVIRTLIAYRPVREKYFRKALEKFYEDNVMYIEIRSSLSELYELDGRTHDKMYMAKLYRDITNKFIKEHPDFMGIKLIITSYRGRTAARVEEHIHFAKEFKEELPDLFAGFDLVGQEDLGRPLKDFVPILKEARDKLEFYLHAGETNWWGTQSDENLIDAVLLNSKRIGHAYALPKHPSLMKAVLKNDIALEVNVISNVVLSLVRDVRNHPLASFLANGLPVVLSSDDPGAWGADPLSHDFYVAFVGVASRHYDLRMLKQLALNSIKYSTLDKRGKAKFSRIFENKWSEFISEIRDVDSDTGSSQNVEQTESLED